MERDPTPPTLLAEVGHLIPTQGTALELACGRGELGVWLARRGLVYQGVDVSPVAVELATELAQRAGVADRCRFEVWDLDQGLPPGPLVNLIVSHLYLPTTSLSKAIAERLLPGGVVAVLSLSEVGGDQGRFRARPGQLLKAFRSLQVLDHREADGIARLVARRPQATERSTISQPVLV